MKIFATILLLFTFHSSANTAKGIVVNILPDKLTLSIDCQARADLLREKASIIFICKNSEKGQYFLDFRLNDEDLVTSFKRNSTDVVVNESVFNSYTLYEISAKDSNDKQIKFVSYCTKELCLDLVGEYEKSVKDSITLQLQG